VASAIGAELDSAVETVEVQEANEMRKLSRAGRTDALRQRSTRWVASGSLIGVRRPRIILMRGLSGNRRSSVADLIDLAAHASILVAESAAFLHRSGQENNTHG
jgi:hypothetical protein